MSQAQNIGDQQEPSPPQQHHPRPAEEQEQQLPPGNSRHNYHAVTSTAIRKAVPAFSESVDEMAREDDYEEDEEEEDDEEEDEEEDERDLAGGKRKNLPAHSKQSTGQAVEAVIDTLSKTAGSSSRRTPSGPDEEDEDAMAASSHAETEGGRTDMTPITPSSARLLVSIPASTPTPTLNLSRPSYNRNNRPPTGPRRSRSSGGASSEVGTIMAISSLTWS